MMTVPRRTHRSTRYRNQQRARVSSRIHKNRSASHELRYGKVSKRQQRNRSLGHEQKLVEGSHAAQERRSRRTGYLHRARCGYGRNTTHRQVPGQCRNSQHTDNGQNGELTTVRVRNVGVGTVIDQPTIATAWYLVRLLNTVTPMVVGCTREQLIACEYETTWKVPYLSETRTTVSYIRVKVG